jgi:hypothetical protein
MRITVTVFMAFAAIQAVFGGYCGDPGPSLTADANVVIDVCHITYEVRSATDIRKTTVYKATVLNQSGRSYGRVSTVIDSQSKITGFTGSILNADGTQYDKIKMSDLKNVPSYPDFIFASEDRLYYYEPAIKNYPYTLTYEMVVSYSGLMAFETWLPVDNLKLACDTASFTIIYPDGYEIRYRSFNIPDKPSQRKLDGNRSLISWSINDFAAIELNNFIPSPETFLPCLMVMPQKFCYDGHDGEFSDAKSYGSWVATLLMDRDELNPEVKMRIAELTAGDKGLKEKVSTVYRFLQENTRYVAVNFGIGGIQPAPADKVSQYGYGDCKGLSNYMKSLLASVGIRSYYTEIGNGKRQITYEDFTYLQTNHVILCVPDGNDTIWLECTSPYYNPGYLGYSNSNRRALLVTEEGGILVSTPRADSSNSYRRAKYELIINADGSSPYKITTEATGHYYEELLYLDHSTRDEAIRYLYRELPLKNHTITTYDISPDTNRPAALNATIEGTLNKYCTVAGNRLIVPLIPYKMFGFVPKLEPERKVGIRIYEHTACSDTIKMKIPEGYKAPVLDETKEFSNEIGRYRQYVSSDGSNLLVIRDVVIPAGNYPAGYKDKVTEFFKKCHNLEIISAMCERVQ